MITNIKKLEKYCTDYKNIENYEEALKSPLKYDLHHRREISENKSASDLIDENLYYGRPPEELIFIEAGEHKRLHQEGKNLSTETRQKISEAHKGHLVSEDTRKKISENNCRYWKGKPGPNTGKHPSAESRQKISEAQKGKSSHWRGLHWHTENGHRVWT
jgi:hypothetical protein